MTRLIDSLGRIAEITMNNKNGIDWSSDFFQIGGLHYDDENDAYKVYDVEYCIDMAYDCQNYKGDYYVPEDERENYDITITIAKRVNYTDAYLI